MHTNRWTCIHTGGIQTYIQTGGHAYKQVAYKNTNKHEHIRTNKPKTHQTKKKLTRRQTHDKSNKNQKKYNTIKPYTLTIKYKLNKF